MMDFGTAPATTTEVVPEKTGRRRGTHSVKCINPSPVFERQARFKPLPGALGHLMARAKSGKIHKHHYFVQMREAMNRSRGFRPERRALIDALALALLDCVDLSTQVPTVCLERLAEQLGVTVSRVSRLVNQIFIPAGLMYVQSDSQAYEKRPDFGMVWDRVHGIWFPKVMVLTDMFFEILGADAALMERLRAQFAQALANNKAGLSAPGEILSLAEARRRIQQRAFKQAWEKRKDVAAAQKRKVSLSNMESMADRLHYAASALIKADPKKAHMTPDAFKKACWDFLHSMDAATFHPPRNT